MHKRLLKLYQSRPLLSANTNIILAGLLAIAVAAYPVHVVNGWVTATWGESLHQNDLKLVRTITATVLDGIVDILLFFGLHWIANHWRPLGHHCEKDKVRHTKNKGRFLKGAGRIQLERIAMGPLFYLLAMGGMFGLLKAGFSDWVAFSASFGAAILITRLLHTLYWIRTKRFDVQLPLADAPSSMLNATPEGSGRTRALEAQANGPAIGAEGQIPAGDENGCPDAGTPSGGACGCAAPGGEPAARQNEKTSSA